MANKNVVCVTLATRFYYLFDNLVKPKANDIHYCYMSSVVESDR